MDWLEKQNDAPKHCRECSIHLATLAAMADLPSPAIPSSQNIRGRSSPKEVAHSITRCRTASRAQPIQHCVGSYFASTQGSVSTESVAIAFTGRALPVK